MTWRRIALIAYCVVVAAGLVLLGFQEADTQRRLGPVGVVGPCREFGPENPECRRQSRKIIRSCLTHEDCLKLVFRLTARARRRGIIDEPRSRGDASQGEEVSQIRHNSGTEGGGTSTGSAPPSQPDPPSTGGGSGGNGGSDGGPVSNPPAPPPSPPIDLPNLPEPAQEAVDQACNNAPVSLPICP